VIEHISILSGHGRDGRADAVDRLDLKMGDVISVVGHTGSGKSTLINDIELFADRDTPSGRQILIDGAVAPEEFRDDPSKNPIALITQHTGFLSDLPVGEFLTIHARIRNSSKAVIEDVLAQTLNFANELTGEPVHPDIRMTELSGGQTRAILIADATVICNTPIVLLDEVENAGIHRSRALELLRGYRKIFVFVTHDPRIALLSDYRVIMREGRIADVLTKNDAELALTPAVNRLDDMLSGLREKIRRGERVTARELEGLA
jgi:ABC-type lipoprotein export system ATPase subunit